MPRDYNFWVYIVTNRNYSVLYIGVTNRDVRDAIAHETQLKRSSRSKKVELIDRLSPSWLDLGLDVLQEIFRLRLWLRSK